MDDAMATGTAERVGMRSNAKFRVLGENDDASDCCCCGRQGLRRVVWLQPLDEDGEDCGAPVHFGRVCGAKAAGWGYGSDAGRIDRRIRSEELASRKHYAGVVSDRMKSLVASGEVVQSRVAYGFDWKSGTHHYGFMYLLPDDPITAMMDPVYQRAELPAAKARLRDRFPVFRVLDENLTAAQLKALT